MKNLLKLLSPFAPDQSGASSVLYELSGLIVICDAGGCAGNVCGFDEPRWFTKKSAVFSAGLRDMDAIMGRDDLLIAKTADAAKKTNVRFTAIIGTPVPAVIATDYRALKRMAEKKTGIPCITIDTNGALLYDEGEEKAYLELFKTFAEDNPQRNGKIGVIGATPLEISRTNAEIITSSLSNAVCYGMGSTLDDVIAAGGAEKNIVITPAGIKAAEYLKQRFGTPYEVMLPYQAECDREALSALGSLSGKKILIIHQQVIANALRREILAEYDCECTVGSCFMMNKPLSQEKDFRITDEQQLAEIGENGGFDVILADKMLFRPMRKSAAKMIDFPHFAVSGRLVGGEKCPHI